MSTPSERKPTDPRWPVLNRNSDADARRWPVGTSTLFPINPTRRGTGR